MFCVQHDAKMITIHDKVGDKVSYAAIRLARKGYIRSLTMYFKTSAERSLSSKSGKRSVAVMKKIITGFSTFFILLVLLVVPHNMVQAAEEQTVEDYLATAKQYLQQKDYNGALKACDQGLKLDPQSVKIYEIRGDIFTAQGNTDKAIADYNQAISLGSNSPRIYFSRGNKFLMKGMFDKAITDCNTALELRPDYYIAYILRGNAYYFKGMNDKALEDFKAYFRSAPSDDPARASAQKLLPEGFGVVNTGGTTNVRRVGKIKPVSPDVGNVTMNKLLINGVSNNDMSTVKMAVEGGANVNIFGSYYNTVLIMAMEKNNIEMINYLIDHGADVNVHIEPYGYLNGYFETPLMIAVRANNIDLVKILINAGADINAYDPPYKKTPLFYALFHKNTDILQYLIAQGADVNFTQSDGTTHLMTAAANNKLASAKILLEAGADPTRKNKDGKTALIIAIEKNNKELIDLLLPLTPH
ncbi:lipoprotein NlpI precursor [Methylomusa anaerophila]|uniref:Lipoprotein NlpI n=2 Tax=Methylomusa anaerophila TaxID=1930071 RepID=A0A348AL54_9FIRM|nr:lipoprotein NlpI precursor [Methylomusa anaerophila]